MTKRGGKHASADATPPLDAPDADVFAREMADVVRLPPDPRGRVRPARVVHPLPPARTAPAPAHTPDGLDEPDDDFAAAGIDRREIRKLKRGEYIPGARLDMHGMTAAEAATTVHRFVEGSRSRRLRCVCIVHGRGLHSERNASILRPLVRERLRSHPAVLAYADAPRGDGGAGAVYVLLRK